MGWLPMCCSWAATHARAGVPLARRHQASASHRSHVRRGRIRRLTGTPQLGIPTANIPLSGLSVGGSRDVESGIYYGWAGLSASKATAAPPGEYTLMKEDVYQDLLKAQQSAPASSGEGKGAVYPMVMSIGWNPFYKNEVRSVEVHIMHGFPTDFYDSHMNLIVLGFIRPEYDYVSKESLIDDIKTDIDVAGRSLARKGYVEVRNDAYLTDFSGKSEVAS